MKLTFDCGKTAVVSGSETIIIPIEGKVFDISDETTWECDRAWAAAWTGTKVAWHTPGIGWDIRKIAKID